MRCPGKGIDGECGTPKECNINMRCLFFETIELVNHPAHYGGEDNPYEVIKVLRAWSTEDEFYGWLKLTIIKYWGRIGKKDPALQDLGKLIWYSNYLEQWMKETGYQPK